MRRRTLERKALQGLLSSGEIDRALDELRQLPGRRFVHPLLSALCGEEEVRWHAVTAMGVLVADLAGTDLESARVVMRTLMWNLTEECGGIAWGVPESMGEILARHGVEVGLEVIGEDSPVHQGGIGDVVARGLEEIRVPDHVPQHVEHPGSLGVNDRP